MAPPVLNHDHGAVVEVAYALTQLLALLDDLDAERLPGKHHCLDRVGQFVNACRGVGSSGNLDALLRSSCEAVALEAEAVMVEQAYGLELI